MCSLPRWCFLLLSAKLFDVYAARCTCCSARSLFYSLLVIFCLIVCDLSSFLLNSRKTVLRRAVVYLEVIISCAHRLQELVLVWTRGRGGVVYTWTSRMLFCLCTFFSFINITLCLYLLFFLFFLLYVCVPEFKCCASCSVHSADVHYFTSSLQSHNAMLFL